MNGSTPFCAITHALEDYSQTMILLLHFAPTTTDNSLLHMGKLIGASNTACGKYLQDFISLSSVKHTSKSHNFTVSPCDCCGMPNQESGTHIISNSEIGVNQAQSRQRQLYFV